jgi:hypothetical protein
VKYKSIPPIKKNQDAIAKSIKKNMEKVNFVEMDILILQEPLNMHLQI